MAKKCVECGNKVEGYRNNSNVCEKCFKKILRDKL